MALPQNPYLHNSRLHSHTLMRGNIFPLERRSGAAEVDSKEKRVTYLWQFRIGLLPLLLYVSIQRTSIFAHHQVCIKKNWHKKQSEQIGQKSQRLKRRQKKLLHESAKKILFELNATCMCMCLCRMYMVVHGLQQLLPLPSICAQFFGRFSRCLLLGA